jgi:hypothetical protein
MPDYDVARVRGAGLRQKGLPFNHRWVIAMLARTPVSALVMDVTGMAVPDFQELLSRRAAAAADWLTRSIEACGGQGTAGYYSRLHHPLRGWAPAFRAGHRCRRAHAAAL